MRPLLPLRSQGREQWAAQALAGYASEGGLACGGNVGSFRVRISSEKEPNGEDKRVESQENYWGELNMCFLAFEGSLGTAAWPKR